MKINWGWKIVIAYAVFIIGTSAWVAYAMTSDVGLVREDYYEHSLMENQTMAARSSANALGAAASIAFDQKRDNFIVHIPSNQAASAKGTVTLYRPNSSKEDRIFNLMPAPDGTMIIPASTLSAGIWQVTAEWSFNGKSYQLIATETI
jgi:nitrogen fixation protein FixH